MLRWLPENISSYGHDMDSIMYLIYYHVGAWFIVAEGVLIWFAWSSRRRPGSAGLGYCGHRSGGGTRL